MSNYGLIPKKLKMVYKNVDQTTTVASGTSEIVTITPPTGRIWRLMGIWIHVDPPPGATSGTHTFGISAQYMGLSHADWPYTSKAGFFKYYWRYSPSAQEPPTNDLVLHGLFRMIFTKENWFKFGYINNTDADQTNARTYRVVFQEETIA